ncbi:MAG: acyltransferase [Paludibacteraceae bacterium]|nr:acyltransferase [Paludibacteraceae bacterium]
MSAEGWNAKSRGNATGYRIFGFFLRHFGLNFAYINLAYVVLYFVLAAPAQRAALWDYYRRTWHYGRLKSAWCVYLHFFRFGQCLVDKMAITQGLSDKFEFVAEGYDDFLESLNRGSAIMIGAHVGAWETGTPFFGDYAKRMHIVMFDAEYQKIKEAIHRGAPQLPYNIIAVNEDDLGSILKISEALQHNAYVCMQGDRYVNNGRCERLDFMGREAVFPQGPFILGAKMRVPVYFYFSMREGKKYHFYFYRATVSTAGGSRACQLDLMRQYVSRLEQVLHTYPQQWFNLYRFWSDPSAAV